MAGEAAVAGRPGPRDRPVWLLTAGIALFAGGLQFGVVARLPPEHQHPALSWPLFALLFAVAEACVVHIQFGREAHSFSLGEVPLVVGLFCVQPAALVAARLLGGALALAVHRRQSPVKLCYNVAQWWLETAVAVSLWHALRGPAPSLSSRAWIASVAAIVVVDALAAVGIWLAIRLRSGGSTPVRSLWRSIPAGSAVAVANTCLALVAVDVLTVDWLGAWTLAVIWAVLFAAHRAHVRLRQRHDALENLSKFTMSVGSDLSVDTIVGDTLGHVRDLLQAETVQMELDPSFAGARRVYRRCESGLVADSEPVAATAGDQVLVAPLQVRGVDIGRLTVVGRQGDVGGFDVEDRDMMVAIAGHTGVALDNGRLADRLRGQVEENAYRATHDTLTGLANRLLFERTVADGLAGGQVTVVMLDIDRFREVNDTLGHSAGDTLLCEVAGRLTAAVPQALCVARFGNDEFGVALTGADVGRAYRSAAAVRSALQRPHRLCGIDVAVDTSLGVAMSAAGGQAAALLRKADVAMYDAKRTSAGIEVYTAGRDRHSADRLALVAELRTAIDEGGLQLAYQPKVALGTGVACSVEALVRWQHPKRGLIQPDEFIPIAERTGLVGPLTDWVIDESLRQVGEWQEGGIELDVAVNLSPRTLGEQELSSRLATGLRVAGLQPHRLTLEVTEGAVMADPQRALDNLHRLASVGIRLSIDDFGVGHSSLAYVKRLPVHEVKIDKSFVTDMTSDADDDATVRFIVQLAHQLGLSCVAEGIEAPATWQRLRDIGCDLAQGYWLGRPMPGSAIPHWLRGRATSPV